MTTSIVFNDLSCADISNATYRSGLTLSDPITDQERYDNYPNLLDPTEPQTSLQRLRVLKTRLTGEFVVTPDTVGRATGNQVPFGDTNPTYSEYKMRRKAEVLNSQNKQGGTSRGTYAYTSKYGKISNARIKLLKAAQNCETNDFRYRQKPASNSGVRGDQTILFLNPNIKYFSTL
jgi:hypothetical protein